MNDQELSMISSFHLFGGWNAPSCNNSAAVVAEDEITSLE